MGSMLLSIFLLGGFFDWGVAGIGIAIAVEVLLFYRKKRPVYKKKQDIFTYIPVAILIGMLVSTLWAVDSVMNLFGVLRGIVVLMWMYLCFQMEEDENSRILEKIPYIGAIMVLIGIISQLHEGFASLFWQARRFGGFFQYANTCALFLMAGIIVIVQWMTEDAKARGRISINDFIKVNIKEVAVVWITLILLIAGVFLTGSRSVLLLLLAWGMYRAFTIKQLRVPITTVSIICIGGAYLYGVAVGDRQNIARIFTLSSANSTILGRLLYYIDGLAMVKSNPFGLGYMGYYYMQPAVQTGVYTTRFIHNDFLQILVDYGIVVWLAIIVYLAHQLFKGRQGRRKKELLIVILLASLVDFHMQYMSILMIVVLCLDLGDKERARKRKELRENYGFCIIAMALFMYIFVACGAYQMKNSSFALQLIPGYTEAKIQCLNESTDKNVALLLADDILANNKYIAEAYHTKVYAAAMETDYEAVLYNMDKVLTIKRYDVERYKEYDNLLEELILVSEKEMPQEVERLRQYKDGLPKQLALLEESTHPIAFMLRDKPVFSW